MLINNNKKCWKANSWILHHDNPRLRTRLTQGTRDTQQIPSSNHNIPWQLNIVDIHEIWLQPTSFFFIIQITTTFRIRF